MAIGAAAFMLAAVFAVGYAEGDGQSLFGQAAGASDGPDGGSPAADETGTGDGGTFTAGNCPCPQAHHEADVSVDKEGELELIDDHFAKVRFTVTVSSIGDSTAENVTLLDDLPAIDHAYWSIAGADAASCWFEGDLRVRCDFGDMATGETREVVFRASKCEFDCGDKLENDVVVSADNDANDENDRDTAVIEFPPCPGEPAATSDVGVDKTGAINGVEGSTAASVDYTITVTATGDVPSENVVLKDTLPDLEATWHIGGDSEGCVLDGNKLTCSFGDLSPGESRAVTASAHQCEVGCKPFTNTAFVSSDNDQDQNNNQDSVTLVPTGCPGDAEVEKKGAITNQHGTMGTVKYTITIRSIGEGTVRDVVLKDELPDLSSQWQISGTHGSSCQLTGNSLTCWFGHMMPGGFRQVVLTATQCEIGCDAFTNTATITGKNDVVSHNDKDSVTLVPKECPDAAVHMTGESQDQGDGFHKLIWTITVTSVGEMAVHEVVLTDELPHIGAEWSLSGPDAGACTFDGEIAECDFGTLTPGEERTIVITSDICVPDKDVTNTAVVSARDDVNTANDSATVTIPATA